MNVMKSMPRSSENLALALTLFLVIFGAFFRVLRLDFFPDAWNFAPLMAIACCGALLLPGWLALVAPLGALVLSDIVLNAQYGVALVDPEVLPRYLCFAIAALSGIAARRWKAAPMPTFGIVAANSVFFYLFTNVFSWLGNPTYAKTTAGLVQALTVGVPGQPPTWMFFRNSLISDLFFTGVFLLAFHLASREPRTSAVHA